MEEIRRHDEMRRRAGAAVRFLNLVVKSLSLPFLLTECAYFDSKDDRDKVLLYKVWPQISLILLSLPTT
jgi:hypothetical protein